MFRFQFREEEGDEPTKVFVRADGGDYEAFVSQVIPAPVSPPEPEPSNLPPVEALFSKTPFYVAHRLGGTEYPEHTMAGMQASVKAGFKAFEFSTYRSSDGVFVGSHDWTTERTTGTRYEIWSTPWGTLATLQQQAGPLIRLEDAVAAMPANGVLVLDHKATSARAGAPPQGDLDSENALFAELAELFPDPTKQVVWKTFVGGSSAERARARGFTTMCMLYASELATADLNRWDVLGLEYNATQSAWDTINKAGKPTIAHIITTASQASTARGKGAKGFMSSVPSAVHP